MNRSMRHVAIESCSLISCSAVAIQEERRDLSRLVFIQSYQATEVAVASTSVIIILQRKALFVVFELQFWGNLLCSDNMYAQCYLCVQCLHCRGCSYRHTSPHCIPPSSNQSNFLALKVKLNCKFLTAANRPFYQTMFNTCRLALLPCLLSSAEARRGGFLFICIGDRGQQ